MIPKLEVVRDLTLGEIRVGYNFNPTENEKVKETKRFYADRIDDLEASRDAAKFSEKNRTIARAQTLAEDTCMLTVKSIFQ